MFSIPMFYYISVMISITFSIKEKKLELKKRRIIV